MTFNPELGSTSPAVLLDNAERLDKLVNGPAADVPDRGGDPLYSWRQMMAKNDEVRQNLIPLSKQYMTLAAAQADIANIPEGSTTYYRSPDDSALAIEVINVGGTLQPTGRKMPSQQDVDQIRQQINYDAVQILKSAYDEDGNVYLLLDEFGELFIANLGPVSVQEKFRKLDALIHKDRAANLHEFPDKNANVPAFIDELGDLYIAGLGPFSVAQKIRAIESSIVNNDEHDITHQYDFNGRLISFQDVFGEVFIPGLDKSVQESIKGIRENYQR
ncbi:hypothetical protein, partial [Klebsiella pneumoniae]|uniref:hypothetical protein n=1 Tax=Klebsiella pneumoniae TaxID=573 RepID=UPI0020741E4D